MSHDDGVQQLYQQLQKLCSEPTKALPICDKILALRPTEEKARLCKATLQVQLKAYDKGAAVLEGTSSQQCTELRAYCLYRCDKFGDAIALLRPGAAGLSSLGDHVLAQSLYNSEQYAEAAAIYEKLLKEGRVRDEQDKDEILINLSACYATIAPAKALETVDRSAEVSHDLLYNIATAHIEARQWKEAREMLNKALQLCRRESNVTEQQVQDALAAEGDAPLPADVATFLDDATAIRVQQAYLLSMTGDEEGALAILTEVFKHKPKSVSAVAVASINWAALKRSSEFFDTYRKLKHVQQPAVEAKLTSRQRLYVRYNTALLLMGMGKLSQARTLIEEMCKADETSDLGPLAMAALLLKDKKMNKAEEYLSSFVAKRGTESSANVHLTLAQMWLTQGSLDTALSHLRLVQALQHKPGAVATLAEGYLNAKNSAEAVKVINEAIAFYEKDKKAQSTLEALLVYAGDLFLGHNLHADAAAAYTKLLALRGGSDARATAGLVAALAVADPPKAEVHAKKLPSVVDSSRLSGLSADAVVDEPIPRAVIEEKGFKRPLDEPDTEAPPKKRRTQRTRPKRMPKKMDTPRDPERWIRMKDRTYIKNLPPRRQKEMARKRSEDEALRRRQKDMAKKKEAAAAAAAQTSPAPAQAE